MNKYPFHDSGIADEGLSDETGSIEDDHKNQENQSHIKNTKSLLSLRFFSRIKCFHLKMIKTC